MRMTDNNNIGETNKYRAEILYFMEACYQLKFDYCGFRMLITILFVITKKKTTIKGTVKKEKEDKWEGRELSISPYAFCSFSVAW